MDSSNIIVNSDDSTVNGNLPQNPAEGFTPVIFPADKEFTITASTVKPGKTYIAFIEFEDSSVESVVISLKNASGYVVDSVVSFIAMI